MVKTNILLQKSHKLLLKLFDKVSCYIRIPFMSDYELIEVAGWKNIHILENGKKETLCSEVTVSWDTKVRGRSGTIKAIRRQALRLQEELEETGSELTICGNCIGTLF